MARVQSRKARAGAGMVRGMGHRIAEQGQKMAVNMN
jgi:hypothetical protein